MQADSNLQMFFSRYTVHGNSTAGVSDKYCLLSKRAVYCMFGEPCWQIHLRYAPSLVYLQPRSACRDPAAIPPDVSPYHASI